MKLVERPEYVAFRVKANGDFMLTLLAKYKMAFLYRKVKQPEFGGYGYIILLAHAAMA
jgi:hypothetical protein